MKQWEKTDEITCEGMWECPDLFEIFSEDKKSSKWVFWSADGYYLLGDFDGYQFKTDGIRHEAYSILEDKTLTRAYAAQTFDHVGGKVLQISWITTPELRRSYNGVLSLPACLSLDSKKGKLVMRPDDGVKNLREEHQKKQINEAETGMYYIEDLKSGMAKEINVTISHLEAGSIDFDLFGTNVTVDGTKKVLRTSAHTIPLEDQSLQMTLFADEDVIEIFIPSECKYLVIPNEKCNLEGHVYCEKHMNTEVSVEVYELKQVKYHC